MGGLSAQRSDLSKVMFAFQPLGRLVYQLDRIDGGLHWMNSRFCGPLSALDRVTLANCPAVSLNLCIYTAGGGNPLYQGELLKQCSSVKNKAIGPIFFAELESCMHEVDKKAKK